MDVSGRFSLLLADFVQLEMSTGCEWVNERVRSTHQRLTIADGKGDRYQWYRLYFRWVGLCPQIPVGLLLLQHAAAPAVCLPASCTPSAAVPFLPRALRARAFDEF